MMRRAMLTAWFSCVLALLSFGFAEPFDPPQDKVKEAKAEKGIAEALRRKEIEKRMEQKLGARMKELQLSELHFMRQVCQPTEEQFEKIAAAGDAEMNVTVKKLAKATAGQGMGRARGYNQSDTRKQITTGILENVKKTLSPERAATYQKELEERDASRRRFVVTNLVWGIDKRLVLSAEQRQKLTEVLMENYRDGWNDTQVIMQGGQYFPSLPEDKINPLLSDTQKAIWRDVNRGTISGNIEVDWAKK